MNTIRGFARVPFPVRTDVYRLALLWSILSWTSDQPSSAPLSAQQSVSITLTTPTCQIELTDVGRLGSLDDPGTVGLFPSVVRTPDGHFVLATQENRGEILVYDPEGSLVQSFGSAGAGPGEFRTPGRVRLGPDGSSYILDTANRRITQVSREAVVLGSYGVGALAVLDFLPLGSGNFVASSFGQDGGVFVARTDIIDSRGAIRQSLDALPVESWLVDFYRGPVAMDDQGRVWSTRAGQYGFDRWPMGEGRTGRVRLEGDPRWFDVGPPGPGTPVTGPVPSVVAGLSVTGGFLRVVTWIGDRDRAADPSMIVGPSGLDVRSILDTVIEVIDPASGEVVAHTVHEGVLQFTGDGGLLFEVRDAGGVPGVVLSSVALVGEECRVR